MHAVYDLSPGGFSHVEGTGRSGAASLRRGAALANQKLIGDRGQAKALRASLDPSGPQARAFIVRVGWRALALRNAAGDRFNLLAQLGLPAIKAGPREYAVPAVVGPPRTPKLVRRLVILLPPHKAAANGKKLKRRAGKYQDEGDPRNLIAAGFMVLVTALPGDILANGICAARRFR